MIRNKIVLISLLFYIVSFLLILLPLVVNLYLLYSVLPPSENLSFLVTEPLLVERVVAIIVVVGIVYGVIKKQKWGYWYGILVGLLSLIFVAVAIIQARAVDWYMLPLVAAGFLLLNQKGYFDYPND